MNSTLILGWMELDARYVLKKLGIIRDINCNINNNDQYIFDQLRVFNKDYLTDIELYKLKSDKYILIWKKISNLSVNSNIICSNAYINQKLVPYSCDELLSFIKKFDMFLCTLDPDVHIPYPDILVNLET